jgi:hypothetical protein
VRPYELASWLASMDEPEFRRQTITLSEIVKAAKEALSGEPGSAVITATPCPTCGGACRVVSGNEGTSHYEPIRGTLR